MSGASATPEERGYTPPTPPQRYLDRGPTYHGSKMRGERGPALAKSFLPPGHTIVPVDVNDEPYIGVDTEDGHSPVHREVHDAASAHDLLILAVRLYERYQSTDSQS